MPEKFSIVITVRNEVGNIQAVVEGLMGQSLSPDEIVIVDGMSTDGTTERLRDYEKQGKIRLLIEDCNIARGRNLGVAMARNAWIAVTDAGCRIHPDWLSSIAQCLTSHPGTDVIAGNYSFEIHSKFEEASVLATDSPDRETSDSARYYPSSRSIAFSKEAWQAAKGYPEWLYAAEDTLFNIRLRQLGFKFEFCKASIVSWRPRTSIRSFFRQYFNYALGNGRVGIGTQGYLTNLQFHGATLAFILAGMIWSPLALVGLAIFAQHVKRHLWGQAQVATQRSTTPGMRWRVLAIMELMRLAGMAGFLAGRWDRWRDPSFIAEQRAWMGVDSLDDLVAESGRTG